MPDHPVPEMRLELVPVPVSDVDRAKEFYERIGFGNIHDNMVSEGMRVVQLPPARPHLVLVTQLCCGRGATSLDERRIRAVSKIQERGVDPPTLPRLPASQPRGLVRAARLDDRLTYGVAVAWKP